MPADVPPAATEADAELDRFRRLLRIPTVSRLDPAAVDAGAFAAFRTTLAQLYPRAHAALELDIVAGGGLLYRWPGAAPGPAAVLMAHHDVVPADEPGWTHPPFAAELVGDGPEARIWGRGTLDDKGTLVALFEAVERRLTVGFSPAHDVYLYSGADEETAGGGAEAAVALLVDRGVEIGLVLDEGGAVADDALAGVAGPVAFLGVTEKGLAQIELRVAKPGGHAATPARNGATTTLARAILRLEQHPAPARLSAPLAGMLTALAPRTGGIQRTLFSRAGGLGPVVARILAGRGGESEAMVRTTRAVTRLTGSAADNVVAESAVASVNARIAVDSSIARTLDEIRAAIADDDVAVRLVAGTEPSPASPAEGPAWEIVTAAVRATFPDALPAPYVMLQASDARRFARASRTVYRFMPFTLTATERRTLHAIDESIGVENWRRGIGFFERLLGAL